jgi:hypothetical protein
MADAKPSSAGSKTPADFLKSIKGKSVVVKLNSGVDYRGEPALSPPSGAKSVCAPGLARDVCADGCRNPGVPGRLHEHCHGADRGAPPGPPVATHWESREAANTSWLYAPPSPPRSMSTASSRTSTATALSEATTVSGLEGTGGCRGRCRGRGRPFCAAALPREGRHGHQELARSLASALRLLAKITDAPHPTSQCCISVWPNLGRRVHPRSKHHEIRSSRNARAARQRMRVTNTTAVRGGRRTLAGRLSGRQSRARSRLS